MSWCFDTNLQPFNECWNMSLSTSEIAKLSGVTRRTIRHYHDIGLLQEPRRRPNGYREYSTSDLVALLRIRRLSALGFSLSNVADMMRGEQGSEERLIDSLDFELESQISQLQAIREEIRLARTRGVPADVSPDAFMAAQGVDGPNRLRLGVLLGALFPSEQLEIFAHFVASPPSDYSEINQEFALIDASTSEERLREFINRLTDSLAEARATATCHTESNGKDAFTVDSLSSRLLVDVFFEGLNATQRGVLEKVLSRLSSEQ
ncbi:MULTISPECIES: MerR family transcriptional regulator [Auritidibacter]|nr:MerR family transcriptional regulator [Auritidibacter sp. NML130574]PXA76625.1 hypothetical protein DCC26_09175 [Auritidibacter sp. NML120779]PXA79585.1 hypothetical protein DCC25_08845 [Auritidibacter sp. NML120636]RMX21453.1 MerR family transcriptional regulator [Auritidibacter ignavus]